jgi:hypothetical protein
MDGKIVFLGRGAKEAKENRSVGAIVQNMHHDAFQIGTTET